MTALFFDRAYAQLLEAKRLFGEYTYHDKGADEIMDLQPLAQELREMDPLEAASCLLKLASLPDAELLVIALVNRLEDWDALFEADPRIADYY